MMARVLDVFFPRACAGCGTVLTEKEQVICTQCLHELPLIGKQKIAEDLIKNHFYGRTPVEHAASLLFFQKRGLSQHLIHQLKYRGDERISGFLGEWLTGTLSKFEWPKTIDIVIPVPLHKKRQRKRGFNQVTGFGRALAKNFGALFSEDILIKISDTRTQAFKNRLARTELKGTFFTLKHKKKLKDKHVLLVDDIITTGATLETCAQNLLKGNPTKISLATMAITV